jgi:hypothetical protein
METPVFNTISNADWVASLKRCRKSDNSVAVQSRSHLARKIATGEIDVAWLLWVKGAERG